MRYRLHALGIRPISNIVDMTNLILLEYGQPLHAFDLDLLAGAKIIVQKANPHQKMVTLDEAERTLEDEDLLICDGDKPIAIAGVMGGQDTGVTESTQSILIESAYFNPSGIRRTSKRLKLSSESSYRFERGVDPNMGPQALQAAASLTMELAGGKKVSGLIDCYPKPITPLTVPYRPARFNRLMGFDVSPSDTRRILEGLGASVTGSDENLAVSVPTWRPDIEREVDLIEEVARIRGLSEVPSILPRIRCKVPNRLEYESVKSAKELLAGLGLEEAITYSFVPNDLLQAVGMDKRVVHIANPLNAQRTAMRTTLIAGLLESLKRANSRFLQGIAQFEVAKTFHDQGTELPKETICASGILSGPVKNWIGEKERSFDFYDVKGLVETFIQEYAGTKPELRENNGVPCLHPRRACSVFIEGQEVGFFGELHPTLLDSQKLPAGALAFELIIDKILAARKTPAVNPMSDYPPMGRDVALLIDEKQDAGPVRDALQNHCGPLAKEVSVFDIYRGEGIPSGHKSIAYSIIYQSDERTLTDDEVDKIHQTAVDAVLKQFNATQR
jgi:phenylalanyl-tRNA synthetase beta chain